MEKGAKRKKANYYTHLKPKKGKYRFVLESGIKGFICTCNNREKECVRESYNILNEYADRIYGEEKRNKASGSTESDDDIDKALQQEIEHLKADREKEPSQRRFQAVDSGANNCIFIRTTVEDPVQLVVAILKDLEDTKKQKSRFLLRMIPIEITCKAWPDDIREAADKILDKYFLGGEKKSFSVIFNRRNNNNVPRIEVIKDIASGVRLRNPYHQADLKNPDLSIIVEIIRNICCLSVVPNYFGYRRYNLLEVAATQGTDKDSETSENMKLPQEIQIPIEAGDQDHSEIKAAEKGEVEAPISEEAAAPKNEEEAAPKNEEETAPKNEEEAAPKNEEEAAPKNEEEAAPKNEEEAAPKNEEEAAAAPKNEEEAPEDDVEALKDADVEKDVLKKESAD